MGTEEHIKAYVTKYALTMGILYKEGDVSLVSSGEMFKYGDTRPTYLGEKSWHRTLDAAQARAEQMRKSKIESLEKQIERLKAMEFKKPSNWEESGWVAPSGSC